MSLGKFSPQYLELPIARRIGFEYAEIDADRFARLSTGDVSWALPLLQGKGKGARPVRGSRARQRLEQEGRSRSPEEGPPVAASR